MKKIILLIIVLVAGYYFIFNTSQSPENGEEEYTEYESTEEQEVEPQAKVEEEVKSEVTTTQENAPPEEDPIPTPAAETEKNPDQETLVEKQKSEAMVKAIKNFTPEDLRDVQRYYQRMENRWKSVVQNMLGDEDYTEYEDMRKEFQRERKESFRKFHESMMAKHGKKHVYSPTEYEKEVGKNIQQTYFKRFEERFGSQNYNRYKQTLQRFNSEAKRNQDPAKGLLQVFF